LDFFDSLISILKFVQISVYGKSIRNIFELQEKPLKNVPTSLLTGRFSVLLGA